MKMQALVTHVVVLLVSLYSLKQCFCAWNHVLQTYFLFEEFERNFVDHNVYFLKVQENSYVIIPLYIDDLILPSIDLILLKGTKDNLLNFFEMVDLGEVQYCLGI